MYSISFPCGTTIDEALKLLRDTAKEYSTFSPTVVCADFNDITLTSTMTDDEAYLAITGKTKAQHKKEQQEYFDSIKRSDEAYRDKFTDTLKMYKEVSKKYIKLEDFKDFCKDLDEYLNIGYRTFIIDCLFEVISIAKRDTELEDIIAEVRDKVDKQGHSGNTAYQLYKLVRKYCPHGEDIANRLCPYREY